MYPPEIDDIILHYLVDINPFLSAQLSKYWYSKVMPKIWNNINLNDPLPGRPTNCIKVSMTYKRAYSFYYRFITPAKKNGIIK